MKKFFTAIDGTEIEESLVTDTEVTVEKEETEIKDEPVKEIKPEPKKTTVGVKIGKVTATSLNIRADASLTAPVVRVVPINTELKIIDETKDFFYVEGPDNTLGFCKKDFISIA